MADLTELTNRYLVLQLKNAIGINDKATMIECLRSLSAGNADELLREILHELANYIESEKDQTRHYKSGPKPKAKERRLYDAVRLYCRLMTPNPLTGKRDLACIHLNSSKVAFALVENTDLWNEEGDFSPQWKYPHMERERNSVPLPKDLDVKDYVCDLYGGIKQSTFDHALAEYRKKLKNIF